MENKFAGAWICSITNCGYMYVPAKGDRKGKIPPGTSFENLPEDWRCPICGASKKSFRPMQEVEEGSK
ncbi:MAG: rubredoxin [Caldimicrobium sp.]|nr:rubredoxin [Caldimicrobium sp.]MCX7613376.1 rubredoxin [Caldimicrobium sp.]MDW8182727.1 rubredoxin [Caldimicrobium sp.]